jgi:hypothetical protein
MFDRRSIGVITLRRAVAFAKRQLLAHRQPAFDRRRTTRQDASMFTRVLAIGTACIFMAAAPIWLVQKPSEAVLSTCILVR